LLRHACSARHGHEHAGRRSARRRRCPDHWLAGDHGLRLDAEGRMKTRRVHLPEIIATASFVLLVAAALTGFSTWFAAALLAGIVFPVALFRRLFPQAGLFALALANLLSVYACLYVY